MVSPRLRRQLRRREPQPTDDEDTEDDEDPDQVEEPDSSIEDLVQPADPGQFDRTFRAGDANLNIEGEFDPVAGQRQVIPRVAYVLSYQLVYNPDRERWEPDTGNGTSGTVNSVTVLEKGPSEFIGPVGQPSAISFNADPVDQLDAADLPNNRLVAPADGTYRVALQLSPPASSPPIDVSITLDVNGTTKAKAVTRSGDTSDPSDSTNLSRPLELSNGDTVQVVVSFSASVNVRIGPGADQNYLTMTRLS